MRRIILPQAVRVIVPPLGNEFNAMLKNTTLVSVIGVPELLLATQMITSATFRVFELYTVVALYYLTLTTLWGFVQRAIERRFGEPSRNIPQNSSFAGGLRKILGRREVAR
jgi:polar amino acid transport system permease protein